MMALTQCYIWVVDAEERDMNLEQIHLGVEAVAGLPALRRAG